MHRQRIKRQALDVLIASIFLQERTWFLEAQWRERQQRLRHDLSLQSTRRSSQAAMHACGDASYQS